MCTQAAYAVVLNTEHFVFCISCKHKNKLNQILFSVLCWLKKMHLCSNVLEVRQLWQMPAKGREGSTQPTETQIHVFIGKGTHAALCPEEAGCSTNTAISFSLFPAS